jgi:hypothetical protein
MGLNEDEEPGVNFITLGHLSIFFLFPDCYWFINWTDFK